AASGTVWLALGLATAWCLRRRPARAHSLLTLAAAGALATPLVVVAVRLADWGVLPAASTRPHISIQAPWNPSIERAAASCPREVHPAPPPFASPERESSAPHREAAIRPIAPPSAPPAAPGLPWRTVALSAWLMASTAFALRLLADVAAGWRAVRR